MDMSELMQKFAGFVVSLVFVGATTFNGALAQSFEDWWPEDRGEFIAFVGEKVRYKEEGPPEADCDLCPVVVTSMEEDEATYRILELYLGSHDSELIEFGVHHHRYYPHWIESDFALVFVVQPDEDGKRLANIWLSYPLDPTANEKLAHCGPPTPPSEHKDLVDFLPMSKIEFVPPIETLLSDAMIPEEEYEYYSEEELQEENREILGRLGPPVFNVQNGVATCQRGYYSRDLFKLVYASYHLPLHWEDDCERSLEKKYTDRGEDWDALPSDAQWPLIEKCAARLKTEWLSEFGGAPD